MSDKTQHCPGCKTRQDEIESLRYAAHSAIDDRKMLLKETKRLLMEVEIYENALRKITECPHPIPRADGMVDMDWNPARMVQIAEEALKEWT